MTVGRALSSALFCAVLALVAWAVQPERRFGTADGETELEPLHLFPADPGRGVGFVVPPGATDVRISLRGLLPDDPEDPDPTFTLRAIVTLSDPNTGASQDTELMVRSRRSRLPGPGGRPRIAGRLEHDPRVVSDPRSFILPVGDVLPAGGRLRIRPPQGSPALLTRVWGRRQRSPAQLARIATAPGRRVAERVAGATGLRRWGLLETSERVLGGRWTWRSLPPIEDGGMHVVPRHLERQQVEVPFRLRGAAELRLGPGRKLAYNLVGPVEVRLAGAVGLTSLSLLTVSPTRGQRPVRGALPQPPAEAEGEEEALTVRIEEPGPVSLVLFNQGSTAFSPFKVTLEDGGPAQILGWAPATWLDGQRLDPLDPGDHRVLLGPEWRNLGGTLLGDGQPEPLQIALPSGQEPRILLTARALLDGPDDVRPRSLILRALDRRGDPLWTKTASLGAPAASRFESLEEPRATWLSEPMPLTVGVVPGAVTLEVRAHDPMVVSGAVQGLTPPRRPDRAPEGEAARLRYEPFAPHRWVQQPPANRAALASSGQLARIRAATRYEPRGTPVSRRRYATVEPLDAGSVPTTWLLPVPRRSPSAGLWCRFAPGTGQRFAWWAGGARSAGRLQGWVWAERADLGQTWNVRLDGAPWRSGRVVQRITRLSSVRARSRSSVDFSAPAGAALWLRLGDDPRSRCLAPHRPLRAWTLAPGETLTFEVRKPPGEQLLSVGGFAAGDADLLVLVDLPRSHGGMVSTSPWTIRRRTLHLRAEKTAAALRLDDPDARLHPLTSAPLRLGAELSAGPRRVYVQNLGERPVEIRLAAEAAPGTAEHETGPRRVRAGGGE